MIGHAPSDWVEFVYLAPYERFAKHDIPDDVERAFETAVVENPEIGKLVPGLGGVRCASRCQATASVAEPGFSTSFSPLADEYMC